MISQIFIGLFGVGAVWLSQHNDQDLRKYACILGLLSQPFWFYSMYQSQQWGVFVMCFLYTYSWMVGFYNHWVKK